MRIPGQDIPATFIQYAADILADTAKGLSGANIVRATAAYAVEYDVNLPHPTYPFEAGNKRTVLYKIFAPSRLRSSIESSGSCVSIRRCRYLPAQNEKS